MNLGNTEASNKRTNDWLEKVQAVQDIIWRSHPDVWTELHDLHWPSWWSGQQGPQISEYRQLQEERWCSETRKAVYGE